MSTSSTTSRVTCISSRRGKAVFHDLSYRHKIPLSLSLIILLTAFAVSTIFILNAYRDAQQDLIGNALSLGRVLARTLRPLLLHDDLWQTYEVISTPFDSETEKGARSPNRIAFVLDSRNRIYVSTDPRRYRILDTLSRIKPEYVSLERRIADGDKEPFVVSDIDSQRILMVVPILADDDTRLGTLILSYSRFIFLPRFYHTAEQVAIVTLAAIVTLIPVGWYWGKRMTRPLVHLAECMGKISRELPQAIQCDLHLGKDEIGILGMNFKQMLDELKEKQALESQMFASERLAAIGRLTAGIAHEINNPLGGMLNAINTHKRHGNPDPLTGKTISLIERGLCQIKETVAALLVEAKFESHALTPQDIEDAYTLVAADAHNKQIRFEWRNEVYRVVPLASTYVRQILLNLLMNAINAARERGNVSCQVVLEQDVLQIIVTNDGKHIDQERMTLLFEPFLSDGSEGHGLGLWITYQVVHQLNGQIHVDSAPGRTIFRVSLPWEN